MTTWRLKACPRCEGDMYIENDVGGWFEQCLACSYRRDLSDPPTAAEGKQEPEGTR